MDGFKVLILDDQKEQAAFLKSLLEFHYFQVSTVSSPEEALNLFEREKFDVLLSDHRMGGIDGISAFKKITSSLGEIDTKLVLLSYRDLSESEIRDLYDDQVIFFKKPFMPYEFVSRVENLFS